ncbi:MAG TPA: hypothetical protein VN733_07920 [Solirubrobacterales bacterium]|nr:hypothetical protein [Solirubrobacterales bacterium]
MSGYESLRASDYLIEGYLSAAELGSRYERDGKTTDLLHAAEILCGTFGKLREDQEFWAALIDAADTAAKDQAAVREVLSDLLSFRQMEEEILLGLGFPPDEVVRVTSDLISAVRLTHELPRGASIENLRARVADVGERICRASDPGDAEAKQQRKRRLKQGFKVIGGAATAVGNGVAAILFVPTLASMVVAAAAMADAATD